MSDEELTAPGVFSRERHAYAACLIATQVYLIANLVARPAVLIAARVAGLNDKVGNHSYKREAVIETAPDEANKIVHSHRGIGRKQLDPNIAFLCMNQRGWILD